MLGSDRPLGQFNMGHKYQGDRHQEEVYAGNRVIGQQI